MMTFAKLSFLSFFLILQAVIGCDIKSFSHCLVGRCRTTQGTLLGSGFHRDFLGLRHIDDFSGNIAELALERLIATLYSRNICTIIVIGDSLASDTVVAMMCQLGRLQYESESLCNFANLGGAAYYDHVNYTCNGNLVDGKQNCNMSSPFRKFKNIMSKSCKEVYTKLLIVHIIAICLSNLVHFGLKLQGLSQAEKLIPVYFSKD